MNINGFDLSPLDNKLVALLGINIYESFKKENKSDRYILNFILNNFNIKSVGV